MLDETALTKPALQFLTNATKMGVADFAVWTGLWTLVGVAFNYFIEFMTPQLKLAETHASEIKLKYVRATPLLFLLELGFATLYEAFNFPRNVNYQKQTNAIALRAIKNKGLNAKLGDAYNASA